MADFINLNLKNKFQFNTGDIKGGISLDAFLDEDAKKLADAFNFNKTGASANVLDAEEIKGIITVLIQQAGDDLELYKGDAKAVFKELQKLGINVDGLDYDDLTAFIEQLLVASKGVQKSSVKTDGSISTLREARKELGNGKYSITTKDELVNEDGSITIVSETVTVYNSNNEPISSITTMPSGETIERSYKDENGNICDTLVSERTISADGAKVIEVEYDENGPVKRTEVEGINTNVYEYNNDEPRLVSSITNEGLPNEIHRDYTYNGDGTVTIKLEYNDFEYGHSVSVGRFTDISATTPLEVNTDSDVRSQRKVVNEDGSYTLTTTNKSDNSLEVATFNSDRKLTRCVVTKDGKEYAVDYDGNGNLLGYVVDIGLTPQKIADKFGLDVEELLELNADLVKGTGKNRRFEAGSVIKLPGEFSPINTNLVNMRSQAEVQADVATRAQKRQEAKDKVDNMQVITIEQLVGHGYKLRNNFGVRNARELAIMVGNINYAVENGGFNNDEYSMSGQEMNGKCNFTEYELNALTRKIIELNPDLFNTDGTLKYTNHTDKQGKWLVIGSGKYEDMTLQLPATPAMVGETERVQTEQIDRVVEWNVSRAESDGKNIALQVNKAVVNGGSGTDEDLLNSTLARIDSNSVAYAVINYKEQYSEGIMEAIYGDDTEIARKYRDKIVSSLIAKAKELGIDCSNLEYVFVNNKNIYTNAMNSPTWQDESFLDLAYRIQAVENTPVSQRASVLESEITTRTVESAMGDADILADQAWDALKAQHKRNGWTGWTINGIKSITGGTTYGDVESEVLQFMVSLSDCERAYFGVAFEDLQAKYNSLNQQKLDDWNWNILKDTYLENGSDAFKAKYKELTGTELSDDVFNQMETAFIKGLETKGVEAFKKQYETEFGVKADPQMLGAYNLQMQQFTYAKTYEGLSRVFKGYDEKSQEELVALMNEYFPNQEVDYSQYSKEDLVNAIRISLKELKTASGGRKSDDIRADMLNSAKALFPEYADVMDKVLDYNSSQELTKGCFKMGLNIVAAVVVGFLTAGPAGAAAGAKMALSTGTIVVAGVSAATNLGDLAVREIAGDDVSADEWFQATLNVGLDAVMFNGPIKYSRYVDEIADLTKLQKAGKLVAFDASTGIAGDFVREGELTVDGVIYNLVFSGVNLIGLCKKGAPESETIVLPTLDNAVHNPHTSVGISNVSSVRVGARKAEAITAEIDEFIENGNASVDDLVRVRAEVETISNRDLRRSSVTKLNDYIATLPPEQQTQFKQGFTAHLQQRVDGVLSSNKPFMPEDVRLIKEYADNIDDINVLNQLKENILAKQKTSRGAHYDEALSVVDKRINKIKSTPEATPARTVEEPETHTTIGAEVANRDVSIATGARAVDDVQVAREAVDDIDAEVSASSNLPLKQAWQSCKTKIDELLAYTGQITDALKVKLKGALAELDTLISTASGTLKTKFEALKASLIAKFNGLKNNGLRNVDFSRNMSREEIIEEITYRFSRSDVALPQEMIDDFIKNFDFENKTVHLENLATIFNSKCSADLFTLCNERGFFSSKQNGELLDFVLFKCEKLFKNQGLELFNKFDNNQLALIKNRNIISDNLDLVDYKVKLSDEDYNRLYVDGPYAGKLPYISENDYVNEILTGHKLEKLSFSDYQNFELKICGILNSTTDDLIKSEKVAFLKQLVNDYGVNGLNKIDAEPNFKDVYNKAYSYAKENNFPEGRIVIVDDINNMNLHSFSDEFVMCFDNNGNLIRTVRTDVVNNTQNISTTSLIQDYVKVERNGGLYQSTKIVKDNNGNLLYTENLVQSKKIKGKFDIIREYPDGTRSKIASVERSEAGDLLIEKSLEGPNGIKTNYNYIENPNGSKLSITRILDKDGNVIFENKQSFKVIDKNHFKTVENGVEYDIQYNVDAKGNGTVKVTRGDGEVVELTVGENNVAIISKDLLPMLKKMPGSFYFDIKNYGLEKIGKNITVSNKTSYNVTYNLITISDEFVGSEFVLAHEFGHYRERSFDIASDLELQAIFNEERANLLINGNTFEAESMDYFIRYFQKEDGSPQHSLREIVAETNALLYMNNSNLTFESRGMYLQQYFPKTFARAAELLQNPIPIVEPILDDLTPVLGTRPELDKYICNSNRSSTILEEAQMFVDVSSNATLEHASFILSRRDLFTKFDPSGAWWTQFTPADQHHGAWKMHLYSVDELDWQNLSEVVIPYLKENGVLFKTLGTYASPEALASGVSIQAGKAFTIYPRDNVHFEQVARDLDYIIRNNHLEMDGTSLIGDRQMGDNGRLFYRYEYNTGTASNEVLDSSTSEGRRRYNQLYDSNKGRIERHREGRYLADDMTSTDDPWLNFNPADPNSKPNFGNSSYTEPKSPKVETINWDDGTYAVVKYADDGVTPISIERYSNDGTFIDGADLITPQKDN